MLNKDIWFWAYLDDHGRIHVMRYRNDQVIRSYEALPDVIGIFDPFKAENYEEAKKTILLKWEEIKKDFKGSFKNKVIQ